MTTNADGRQMAPPLLPVFSFRFDEKKENKKRCKKQIVSTFGVATIAVRYLP